MGYMANRMPSQIRRISGVTLGGRNCKLGSKKRGGKRGRARENPKYPKNKTVRRGKMRLSEFIYAFYIEAIFLTVAFFEFLHGFFRFAHVLPDHLGEMVLHIA